MHENVLVYRRFRYLKIAALAALVSIVAYAIHIERGPPNGGTWLGYILGTIGALLILWLMWFGVRKRSYKPGHVKIEDWLSAHVYLGLALIIVATLHTGFQFGWNLHTLAYTLMMLVIASGAFGVYAYIRYPRLMTENRGSRTLAAMMGQIATLDAECRQVSMSLGDDISRHVITATESTRIGGSIAQQLSGRDASCPTAKALAEIRGRAQHLPEDQAANARRLLALLSEKDSLLRRARRDVQLKALMDIWLYVHVPLTIALVVALTGHVISVFFYW
jgi:hypothetical protein